MPKLAKLHTWCNKYELLILLVGLVVLFRIPTLFTPHYYGDEEIYFVMGRAWRLGVPMYQAMFDHKPPLIYILAGIAQNVFWFRAILMAAMVLHTVIFYRLAQLFWKPIRPKFALLSSLIFVFLTTTPMFEGNIANAELFMMLPITASLLMVWPYGYEDGKEVKKKYSWQRYLIAGLVAGAGWLFKVPVAFDFMAIALFLFVYREKKFWGSIRGLFSGKSILYILGFVIPLLSTFVYYYLKGNGSAYVDTVLTMNLGYVSSWSTSTYQFNPFRSGLVVRGMVLAVISLLIYVLRNKLDKRFILATLWVSFSFFGSLLSGRPYPHYLQEPFVPLALFLPFIFVLETVGAWLVMAALLIWAAITIKQIGFWAYPTWPLYNNFEKVITRQIDAKGYVNSFDGARKNYAIGEYLNKRLSPNDKIFVWGSDAAIYNITNTLPSGGKYIVDFHVRDLKKFDYVMGNLEASRPKYIVMLNNAIDFPQLDQMLTNEYIPTMETEGNTVYMRIAQ